MQIRFDTITMLKIEDSSDGFPFCVHVGIYMTYQVEVSYIYI